MNQVAFRYLLISTAVLFCICDSSVGQSTSNSYIASSHPDDIYWDNSLSPAINGVSGRVLAVSSFQGKVIVGGTFHVAGSVYASNIAAWDGENWSALGVGTNDSVKVLAVYNNKLYVGGSFTSAGNVSANFIAAWDGNRWEQVNAPFISTVRAMTVFDSELVAAGTISNWPELNVAKWNGARWVVFPQSPGSEVRCLTVFRDSLIAGGLFEVSIIQGSYTNGPMQWTGANWKQVGIWPNKELRVPVNVLTTFTDNLIAGSASLRSTNPIKDNVYSWDGSNWILMDSGLPAEVLSLSEYQGKLYAGLKSSGVYTWNGSNWSWIGKWLKYEYGAPISPQAVDVLYPSDGKLFMGGLFETIDNGYFNRIAAWDGTEFQSLKNSLNNYIYSVASYQDNLIVAGGFSTIGGVSAKRIAARVNGKWEEIGGGADGSVGDLVKFRDKLIVAGSFDRLGTDSIPRIGSWDGTKWESLGIGSSRIGITRVLAPYQDLLAVVSTEYVSYQEHGRVFVYDGKKFDSIPSVIRGHVSRMIEYNDQLIVAGSFDRIGQLPFQNIAAWNGQAWTSVGGGITDDPQNYTGITSISCLQVLSNQLFVGGQSMGYAGNVPIKNFASWNGTEWTAFGNGIEFDATKSTSFDGKLFVSGIVIEAPGIRYGTVLSWDGNQWNKLGSGIGTGKSSERASSMVEHDGALIISGYFDFAGEKIANKLAAWTKRTSTDATDPSQELPSEILLLQNYPNPFNPSTTITFELPRPSPVQIEVFNLLGQHIATLATGTFKAGSHSIRWNANDKNGNQVGAGVYFYRLMSSEKSYTRKMTLLK